MNKKNNLLVKTTRTDQRFSVSMALVATVAILTIGLFVGPHVYAESDSKRARDGFRAPPLKLWVLKKSKGCLVARYQISTAKAKAKHSEVYI